MVTAAVRVDESSMSTWWRHQYAVVGWLWGKALEVDQPQVAYECGWS